MGRRLDLHNKLKTIYTKATNKSFENKIHFCPPATIKLTYPCIVYKLFDMPTANANNFPYKIEHCYELTVIDSDANSPLREEIAKMFTCRFVRSFDSDNLHHYVFHVYD